MPQEKPDVTADATMRVRMLRRQRGLTLKVLAERAGLTESYLSKLERGHSVPSISVALRLAEALAVDVGSLFAEQDASDVVTVVPAGGRTPLATPSRPGSAGDTRSSYEGIATARTDKVMHPFVVRPGLERHGSDFVDHSGDELVFVHAGSVVLQVPGNDFELHAGDTAYFRGGVPHRLAWHDADAEVLIVISTSPSDSPDIPVHG